MKKSLRKTGALIISMVMLLAIGGTVMADADMSGEGGVIGEFGTPDVATTQDKTVKIYKEITAYNPEDCTVNAPAITYEYTITHSAALAGADIYDASSRHDPASNVHSTTKEGIGTPTITGTAAGQLALVPGTDTLTASENGTANRFPLTISFENVDFTAAGAGAGVYRYQIDETTTEATKNASGIAEGAVANTLYMDVYVNGEGNVYGYVLFTNRTAAIDARTDDDAAAASTAGKTEGFVGSKADQVKYGDPATDGSTADKYYTFNLEVEKEVVNDAYTQNNHHEFPFTITLTNSTVTADVLPIMTVGQYATQTALTAAPIAGTWSPTIGHTGKITYVGIPTGTTITIKETNDVTGVTYTSVSTGADTNAASLDIATGEDSNTATVNCNATALTAATENHTGADEVKFTNTMKMISPTGIIIRSAPYLLLFAAGAVLFILIRHGKKNENSEKV
ncbi:MAG: hypothetical protein IKX04_04735 [Clostridiales bacterium]|nr:hypothetical protein [Clostridiales bacterium]MBR5057853.1 hypothetical protein [Clostridiales bacterium]